MAGGGGASDVRQGGTGPESIALVAAGGGGSGALGDGGAGGAGGISGDDGASGGSTQGGGGATPAGGGAGGDGSPSGDATLRGDDGASGTGGAGGGGVNAVGGGGGGGGGFFGGGGGGAAGDGFGSGAGGGGGVNLASEFTLDENTGVDAENDGNGGVQLAYEVGDTSCLAAPLTIAKVTGGTVVFAAGTRFDVTISCVDPTINLGTLGLPGTASAVTLSFVANGAGGASAVGSDTIAFVGPTDCTVTETNRGGATGVSYLCSAQIETFDDGPIAERFGNPSAAAIGPFPDACAAQGAQLGPVLVHIVDPNQSATVTVTNLNDPVAPLVLIAPRFTG